MGPALRRSFRSRGCEHPKVCRASGDAWYVGQRPALEFGVPRKVARIPGFPCSMSLVWSGAANLSSGSVGGRIVCPARFSRKHLLSFLVKMTRSSGRSAVR